MIARSCHAHLALLVLGTLAACTGPAHDPCQAYQSYDNVIHDAAEWAAFVSSGCTTVQGHLTLLAGSADPASAPAVEVVTGGLAISLGEPYREVALPHLRSIGADLIVTSSGAQESVSLPSLTTVGYSVNVTGNGALRALNLPALASTGGGLWVISNTSLEALELPALDAPIALEVSSNLSLKTLSLPALQTAAFVSIGDDPELASVGLPALTEVLDVMSFTYLPALPALDLPKLQTVGGPGTYSELVLTGLTGATAISLPNLRSVQSSFLVYSNPSLVTLTVPALDVVEALWIRANPAFPQCAAIAIRDHLAASCGLQGAVIDNNDTSATCGP